MIDRIDNRYLIQYDKINQEDKELDSSTAAEIWVMTWSGDGKDHLDIGNNPLPANEVNALNVGMLQGIAKEFNHLPESRNFQS